MLKTIQQKLHEASILDDKEPILSFIQVLDLAKLPQNQFKKFTQEELASLLSSGKVYYLLASIKVTDNDSQPTIYLIKVNEKTQDFKLKLTWNLNEIKTITKLDYKQSSSAKMQQQAHHSHNDDVLHGLELLLKSESNDEKKKYIYQCDKQFDRDEFLDSMWKLSEQFLKSSDRPKFVNYSFENKKAASKSGVDADKTPTKSSNKQQQQQQQQQQSDPKGLDDNAIVKMMIEYEFDTSNVDKFIENLQKKLLYLDTSNIESIMNSEASTIKLIEMLDRAVDEIEKIDDRLKEYEDKINAVGDAVRMVGERDNILQLQQNNQHALLDLLSDMISSLEYPAESKRALLENDLKSSQSIQRCVQAANQLLDILEVDIPAGLRKMKAYEEQIKYLDHLKLKFCTNVHYHLRNAIGFSTNAHLDAFKITDNSLNLLPPHRQIFEDLIVYKDIVPWLERSRGSFLNSENERKTYYDDLKQCYQEAERNLYVREIVAFCNCAKAKIPRADQKSKTTGSMENLKGSIIKSFDKSHQNEAFTIRIDAQTKDTLKLVFTKLMNQLSQTVQAEQQFCQEFFHLKQKRPPPKLDDSINKSQMSSSTNNSAHLQTPQLQRPNLNRNTSTVSISSNTSNNSKQQAIDSKTETSILNEIFANLIEEQVRNVMDNIIRADNIMVLFIYSDLLNRVLDSHTNKLYMHQPLVYLLRTSKERCDEYVALLKMSIGEYKVNKKEKIGILKFVTYFEVVHILYIHSFPGIICLLLRFVELKEFVKEAEVCWEPIRNEMYEKIRQIYELLVYEIFQGIENVANESQKTPPDVVRFQNYNQMNHIMRSINGLKNSSKYARDQYVSWKQSYIKEFFGRPLEKIHLFFEKVEAKIERGYKHQDISYQLDLSANVLNEIIREYPAKEVKKGLESLYNKVVKHLVENSSLLEVVWCDMSSEFIKQYKNYENLIRLCYSGHKIQLEFSEKDICQFFQDIAQSH